eukprot:gene22176-25132_t
MGSVFRCSWFWFYFAYVHYIVAEVVNRIALLFQFSGLTVLMLMWIRAISIAKLTDTAYNETSKNLIALSKATVAVGVKDKAIRSQERRNRVQRYHEASQAVLTKITADNLFRRFYLATAVANLAVWVFVLASLADDSELWYDINIIGLGLVCLIIAFSTLFVGVRVSLALHVALSPVYMSTDGAAAYNQEQVLKCVCMGRYGATCEYVMGCCGLCELYSFIFNTNKSDTRQGLQMQREVLKVILSVSTITSIFFLIRSFCFMYRPLLEEYGNADATAFGNPIYPFFFYQIPEMVPNLVIALGISPPNGILRQWVRLGAYVVRVIANKCCIICGDSRQFLTQNSIFDNENSTPQPSFDNRASVILDARSAHTVSESLTSSTEPVTGHHNNIIVHPIASHPSKAFHVDTHTGQARDPSENTQLPPLSPTKARFQEPAQDSVDAMERGDSGSVVSPVHSTHSDAILIPTANQQQKAPQSPKRSTTLSFVSSHSSSGLRSVASSGGEGSTSSSRRPHSPKGAGVAVSLRKNAARGTWEAHIVDTNDAGGTTEDEDAWVRERRDS